MRRSNNGDDTGNGRTNVPWQTVVMVLVAFIVGLFPFVIAQSRYTTKEDTAVIRSTQIEVLQRLANVEAELGQMEQTSDQVSVNTAAIDMLQTQVATLIAQLQSILPGSGGSSDAGVLPGPSAPGPGP